MMVLPWIALDKIDPRHQSDQEDTIFDGLMIDHLKMCYWYVVCCHTLA